MKQVILRQGRTVVEDIPVPMVEPGTVLVGVIHSCVSVGTELSGLKAGGLPLWKRALKQPANVDKALRAAFAIGPMRAWSLVKGQLAAGSATGYSAAGIVLEVGEGIEDLLVGDSVACAGAQAAHHAEVVRVPRNLVVPIPEALDLKDASTVTLGAIALQGVRRAEPTLGETFVVLGLGVIGQLVVQLLKANGCRVIGVDPDRKRIATARSVGLDFGLDPDDEYADAQVARLTDGLGADGVIITAATPSDSVVSTAFNVCRKKGRVVLVGDVGLNLNRADFYQKELDFRISCSYGPGRYDRNYEERGLDYPAGFVRWTENRNMAEYLRLLAAGQVRVGPLVGSVRPIEEATAAYEALQSGSDRPLMVLLSYPSGAASVPRIHRVENPRVRSVAGPRIRLAVVGAGGFAKGMHLPNLRSLDRLFHIRAIVSRTGHNAAATAAQFAADYSSTDYESVLADPDVDAVLIATRHNLHSQMVLKALVAAKHVLVEKPLALTIEELARVSDWFGDVSDATARPVLLTGFNRRFSIHARRIRELTRDRAGPMVLNYRMNAGFVPADHWTQGPEGGGRNLGEACHIYDLFTFLTDSKVARIETVSARPASKHYLSRDNFTTIMTFADGSLASLTYTAFGCAAYPKEQLEIFVDGKVLTLSDYQSLKIQGSRAVGTKTVLPEKGQRAELEAFARAISAGGDWPIPLWQQLQATNIALAVESQLTEAV